MAGEFDLIARYFTRPPRAGATAGDGASRALAGVALGIGDDCALLQPTAGMQLAVSTDMLVEGRHFLSTVPPDRLGHKALAVNLSDLAACGAEPLAFTLALALPRGDEAFLAPFARGLFALADAYHIELAGGDTTAGPLNICITVFGQVPAGQALLRSGARPGDELWVSGSALGDARLALEAFRGRAQLPGDGFETVRRAMELPQPRVALGLALRGVASSAIDLSDGLLGDLGHVLKRSGVGAVVDVDALPRSAHLAAQAGPLQHECLLAGGDDYELLFTAPAAAHAAVRAAGKAAGVALSRCGRIEAAPGLRVVDAAGRAVATPWHAFDHFA
ncbi:MAG: thiamine-phosphate kinase [Leptothrix sp. (in: Bacteria)]|nr:thiamine-phosphate kinase [Leptothrix sp. (in: b-proteobacteria)]